MHPKLKAIIENDALWNFMRFLTVMILFALVYISQTQAGFYCKNFCEASGEDFHKYTPGVCTCRGTNLVLENLALKDTLNQTSYNGFVYTGSLDKK